MSKPDLFFDIETGPTDNQAIIDAAIAAIEAPANFKDADKIAAYKADKAASVIDKLGLDATTGRIVSLGWAVNADEPTAIRCACHRDELFHAVDGAQVLRNPKFATTDSAEKANLERFFRLVAERLDRDDVDSDEPRIVGHYVGSFDVKFVAQRAMILGAALPAWWPMAPKPWGNEILDTRLVWTGGNNQEHMKLDKLCRALGLPGKGDVDGSDVARLFAERKFDEILAYNRDDVAKVQAVVARFRIAYGDRI
jgi:hypothetical protein